jgi:tetratricopeptide (TPR) repeat protein
MDPQSGAFAEKEFKHAQMELDNGNVLSALASLEKALAICDDPHWYSSLGYCIAKERGHVKKGLELCRKSIETEPANFDHYLYMGKVYILAGNKKEALQVLREGMQQGGSPQIEELLMTIGIRKPPVISFLPRSNPINKYLGLILSRLGLR